MHVAGLQCCSAAWKQLLLCTLHFSESKQIWRVQYICYFFNSIHKNLRVLLWWNLGTLIYALVQIGVGHLIFLSHYICYRVILCSANQRIWAMTIQVLLIKTFNITLLLQMVSCSSKPRFVHIESIAMICWNSRFLGNFPYRLTTLSEIWPTACSIPTLSNRFFSADAKRGWDNARPETKTILWPQGKQCQSWNLKVYSGAVKNGWRSLFFCIENFLWDQIGPIV